MKRATVYRRGATIIVHSSSRTIDGVWVLSEPCVRLSSDCADAELGITVLSTLDESRSSVPHPTQWKAVLDPLLRAAGVKTWKTFAKGAVCVEVEEQGGQIALIPTMNLGGNEGFQADESKKRILTVPARSEVVGTMLREVLSSL